MKQSTFRLIALGTLPIAGVGGYLVGGQIAGWLTSLSEDFGGILSLLGYVFGLLLSVLFWASAMVPFRARTGMKSLSLGLDEISAQGGVAAAFRAEQHKLDERRRSDDPADRVVYHGRMAIGGSVVVAVSTATSIALWIDDRIMWFLMLAVPVGTVLGAYHFMMWLRCKHAGHPS